MSIALAVARLIEGQGLGVIASTDVNQWSINIGEEPEKPAHTITIYDTGGPGPDTDEMDVDRRTIQVRVRSMRRANGYERMSLVRRYLLTTPIKTVEGRAFFSFIVDQDIAEIGKDDSNRVLFTMNFTTLSYEV